MILLYDTETTGLPKDWKAPITDVENWPRLVQFAWILQTDNGREVEVCDYIVKPTYDFDIPKEASNVHGITTEIAIKEGCDLKFVMGRFLKTLKHVDALIAHNISFDRSIVGSEMVRLGCESQLDLLLKTPNFCTMKSATDFCKLPGKFPGKYKWPNLQELHEKLTGKKFEDAHNALADIKATSTCYWMLKQHNVKLING